MLASRGGSRIRGCSVTASPLLRVRGLRVDYESRRGFLRPGRPITVLESLDLDVYPRETLGLVGESGSGKTTLLETLLRLRRSTAGTIVLDGHDERASRRERQRQWTRDVQVVFQNPYSSLDPRLRVADIVAEPLRVHTDTRGGHRRQLVADLLERVGLNQAHLRAYPHQLSGGQAQRVAVARSLVLQPRLLLLDEPTSALDVSVQAQVLNLLLELQEALGLTYLFVSHDLAVVQHISHRIAVMYLGQLVELDATQSLTQTPKHPYTQALLAATALNAPEGAVLKGAVPKFSAVPTGCRFHPRCPFAMEICRKTEPPAYPIGATGGFVRCHLYSSESSGQQTSMATSAGGARLKPTTSRASRTPNQESPLKAPTRGAETPSELESLLQPRIQAPTILPSEPLPGRLQQLGFKEATDPGGGAR
jgi:oligopeptide/dipeptide ABC transporter ATP-binding protein